MNLLAPLMLAGLVGLGLPVLAHLLGQEPPTTIRFAGRRFLEPRELYNGTIWPTRIEMDKDGRTAWRLIWEEDRLLETRGPIFPSAMFDLGVLRILYSLAGEEQSASFFDALAPGGEWMIGPPMGKILDLEEKALEDFENRYKIGDDTDGGRVGM